MSGTVAYVVVAVLGLVAILAIGTIRATSASREIARLREQEIAAVTAAEHLMRQQYAPTFTVQAGAPLPSSSAPSARSQALSSTSAPLAQQVDRPIRPLPEESSRPLMEEPSALAARNELALSVEQTLAAQQEAEATAAAAARLEAILSKSKKGAA